MCFANSAAVFMDTLWEVQGATPSSTAILGGGSGLYNSTGGGNVLQVQQTTQTTGNLCFARTALGFNGDLWFINGVNVGSTSISDGGLDMYDGGKRPNVPVLSLHPSCLAGVIDVRVVHICRKLHFCPNWWHILVKQFGIHGLLRSIIACVHWRWRHHVLHLLRQQLLHCDIHKPDKQYHGLSCRRYTACIFWGCAVVIVSLQECTSLV